MIDTDYDIPVRAVCHKFWLDHWDHAQHLQVDLPARAFTRVALSATGKVCAAMDDWRTVAIVDFEVDPPQVSNWTAKGQSFADRGSGIYVSRDSKHVIVAIPFPGIVSVIDRTSNTWTDYVKMGTKDRDVLRGAHYFSETEGALYAALLNGSVIKFCFREGKVVVSDRWVQPPKRKSVYDEHVILDLLAASIDGEWIAGVGANSLYCWQKDNPSPKEVVLTSPLRSLTFVGNSKYFVSLDARGHCEVRDAASGQPSGEIGKDVLNFVVSDDGQWCGLHIKDANGDQRVKVPLFMSRDELAREVQDIHIALSS